MIEAQKRKTDTSFKLAQMFSKVPEVTIFFWIIKIFCTTIGETAADFLNVNLNFGLTGTSVVTGILLAIVIFFQFRAKKYIPWLYWLTVALVSVFGTLVTDNLTDRLGVPLETSTIVFSILLGLTFLWWYLKEKTLSIHSIYTRQREAFYWLAILFTFALGTATGDLVSEALGVGYFHTGLLVAAIIAIAAIAWRMRLNPVLSFWIIYIMTRPLGASLGDYLSQSKEHGGLGLGVTITSVIFILGILATVAYLSISKKDVIGKEAKAQIEEEISEDEHKGGLLQTIIVLALFLVFGLIGYHYQKTAIEKSVALPAPAGQTYATPLGDLSQFKVITQDTLDKLNAGDQAGATTRIGDLEYAWDTNEAQLKPRDTATWTIIDGKIDTVLRELRAVHPNPATEKTALETLLAVLK